MPGSSINHAIDEARDFWWSFGVVCLGYLMVIIDGTIVNIAIPSIRSDLALTESSLVWIVNAYLLTFGSFLILGGRLGDLFGVRLIYLAGMALFTLASLVCGLAGSQELLVAGRAVQGLASAAVSAVSLLLIGKAFTDTAARAQALGVYAFVSIVGQGLGLILGGVLTASLSWRWIFLVNIPLGLVVLGLGCLWLPKSPTGGQHGRLDLIGATTGTAALTLLVYATVNSDDPGRESVSIPAVLTTAGILLALFVAVEGRAPTPVIPLGLFRQRNLFVANVTIALYSAAILGWYFIATLYLQVVLGYTAFQSSLAFLPASALTALLSFGPCVRALIRFGIKPPIVLGLLVTAAGLLLFATVHVGDTLVLNIILGMILMGIGAGITETPLYLAALSEVAPEDSGLGSGVIGTSSVVGGVLGLATITRISNARTKDMLVAGEPLHVSMIEGYRTAFLVAAILVGVALVSVMLLFKNPPPRSGGELPPRNREMLA